MQADGSITGWIGRLKTGDAEAAQRLWERYFQRLVDLAREKLPRICRRGADEDDVAQSVFIALCNGAETGRLEQLANRDDLWWFLLAATRQKIVDHVRAETAQKRDAGRVQSINQLRRGLGAAGAPRLEDILSSEPSPELIAMLEDEQRRLLGLLRDDQLRQVATLRIEGYAIDEIAERVGIAPRSVKRKLNLIRNTWANEVRP